MAQELTADDPRGLDYAFNPILSNTHGLKPSRIFMDEVTYNDMLKWAIEDERKKVTKLIADDPKKTSRPPPSLPLIRNSKVPPWFIGGMIELDIIDEEKSNDTVS